MQITTKRRRALFSGAITVVVLVDGKRATPPLQPDEAGAVIERLRGGSAVWPMEASR